MQITARIVAFLTVGHPSCGWERLAHLTRATRAPLVLVGIMPGHHQRPRIGEGIPACGNLPTATTQPPARAILVRLSRPHQPHDPTSEKHEVTSAPTRASEIPSCGSYPSGHQHTAPDDPTSGPPFPRPRPLARPPIPPVATRLHTPYQPGHERLRTIRIGWADHRRGGSRPAIGGHHQAQHWRAVPTSHEGITSTPTQRKRCPRGTPADDLTSERGRPA